MDLAPAYRSLTADRWDAFAALFGERGACGGCWCMFWRLDRRRFEAQKGEGNKRTMMALVESGETPGILAFQGPRAVGWCAVAPRDRYPYLDRSRILKPVDDKPCWSVSCFFIDKQFRRQGLSRALLEAAADFARSRGAERLEGYPVEPRPGKPLAPAFAWTGISRTFQEAGFREVARRSPTRPIMRLELHGR